MSDAEIAGGAKRLIGRITYDESRLHADHVLAATRRVWCAPTWDQGGAGLVHGRWGVGSRFTISRS